MKNCFLSTLLFLLSGTCYGHWQDIARDLEVLIRGINHIDQSLEQRYHLNMALRTIMQQMASISEETPWEIVQAWQEELKSLLGR